MDRSATSFTGHPKHTQPEQGREERFTPMKRGARQGGIKQAKRDQFLLVVL